jgi:hypothetical protein
VGLVGDGVGVDPRPSVTTDATEKWASTQLTHAKGQTVHLSATEKFADVSVFENRGTQGSGAGTKFLRGPSAVLTSFSTGANLALSREGELGDSNLERAAIWVSSRGEADLQVHDEERKASVQVGVAKIVDTKTGAKTTTAPGITIFGLDGKVIDRLPK